MSHRVVYCRRCATMKQRMGPSVIHISNTDTFLYRERYAMDMHPQPKTGEEVRFRVLQPHGRNRQHAFILYGHDYEDMLPRYGSRSSSLISIGKAVTVTIPEAHPGRWLYRDGSAHMWSSGMWGGICRG